MFFHFSLSLIAETTVSTFLYRGHQLPSSLLIRHYERVMTVTETG